MTLKIKTNYVPRHTVNGIDLTPKERKEFDYYTDEILAFSCFVRYRGEVYDLSEFLITDKKGELGRWDGLRTDSYFSGILLKFCHDSEQVLMGRAYW